MTSSEQADGGWRLPVAEGMAAACQELVNRTLSEPKTVTSAAHSKRRDLGGSVGSP